MGLVVFIEGVIDEGNSGEKNVVSIIYIDHYKSDPH